MDVVGHDAVAGQGEVVQAAIMREQLEVHGAVLFVVEDVPPGIAALGNVMRDVGSDDTGESRHK